MLTRVDAGAVTIRGVSVGGIYTSLHVPELGALFDVGIAARSSAAVDHIFLSHGHVDHAGALSSLLGIRALVGKQTPPRVYLPAEIEDDLREALTAMSRMQRYELAIDAVPLRPGDEVEMKGDLRVRAFRTYHPVPSLGYQILRHIRKLRPAYRGLSGPEIRDRRRAGDDIFDTTSRTELAYATDTLVEVLDREPSLFESRTLILECTFLDDRKPRPIARAGCHIHLDELLERADRFANEALVLMHFSQIYRPPDVVSLLDERCPPALRRRIVPFVPTREHWPG